MQKTGDRVGRAVTRGVVAAAFAAATILTALPTSATAAEAAAPAALDGMEHKALAGWKVAAKNAAKNNEGVGTQSTGSGSRSGDFTLDNVSDILARQADNGILKVYPHSGAFNGTATYLPSVTINAGWGSMRWIGQGDMNGDGNPDVVYIDSSNVMRVAPHSGIWNGTSTLTGSVAISTGWQINDLVTTADLDGNGLDDIIARGIGTDTTYVYFNTGLNGFSTLQPAQRIVTNVASDVEQIFADYTGDGVVDLLFVLSDGRMGVHDPTIGEEGETYLVSYGWQGVNAFVATDVNADGWMDILARLTANGNLVAYRHSTSWAPAADGTAFNTLTAGVGLGSGWHTNNVIS